MNSHLLQGIAIERTRDMRNEATAASQARAARFARSGRRVHVVMLGTDGRLVRRTAHP